MDIKKLQRVVIDALEDVKAQNIKVFNTVGLSDMFDRVVLASGTSNRQTRALAYRVAQQVKEAGGHVVSVEGADAGEWVLVDLGDLVVHVMQPAIRDYYALEEIWGGKPVRVKTTEPAARRIAAHASEDEPAAERAEPARSAASSGVAAPVEALAPAAVVGSVPAPASTERREPAVEAVPARRPEPAPVKTKATAGTAAPARVAQATTTTETAQARSARAAKARKAAPAKKATKAASVGKGPARKASSTAKTSGAAKSAAASRPATPVKAAGKRPAKPAARRPAKAARPAAGRSARTAQPAAKVAPRTAAARPAAKKAPARKTASPARKKARG